MDEQAIEGDRCGQEQGVQRWCVEALADERCGADNEHTVAGSGVGELVDRGPPFGGGHATLQHQRVVAAADEHGCQGFDMGDPSGEDEAVTASGQGGGDVGDQLGVAVMVGDEGSVHLGERAGRRKVDAATAEVGFVDVQDATGSGLLGQRVQEGAGFIRRKGVADGSELPGYEFAESVATDWGGGQPEPELGTDAFDGVVVGGGIDRLPHSNRYQLTPLGRWVPVIFTKAYGRILAPVLTYLDPALPADLAKQHTLATAWRTLDRELDRFVTGGVAAA